MLGNRTCGENFLEWGQKKWYLCGMGLINKYIFLTLASCCFYAFGIEMLPVKDTAHELS